MTPADPRVDRGARGIQREQPEVPVAAPSEAERAAADSVLARYPDLPARPTALRPARGAGKRPLVFRGVDPLSRAAARHPLRRPLWHDQLLWSVQDRAGGSRGAQGLQGTALLLAWRVPGGRAPADPAAGSPGEPTPDGALSWEWFDCLGQCDFAPAILVGEEAVRSVTPETLERIVREMRG